MIISKAEEFIHEHTMNRDNLLYRGYIGRFDETVYQPWLTPYQALRAVEIAREEIYDWLQEHSQEYVYWMDEEFGKDNLINDLKKYLNGKV